MKWSVIVVPPPAELCAFLLHEKELTAAAVPQNATVLIMSCGIIKLTEVGPGKIALTLLNTIDVEQLKFFTYDGHIRTFPFHHESSVPATVTLELMPSTDNVSLMLNVTCLCGCGGCKANKTSTVVRVVPRSIADMNAFSRVHNLGTLAPLTSDLLVDILALWLPVRSSVVMSSTSRFFYILWHRGACPLLRKAIYQL